MEREYKRHLVRQMHEQYAVQAADYMIEEDLSIAQISREMCLPITRIYRYLAYILVDVDSDRFRQCKRIRKLHRWNRAGKVW